MHPNPPNHRFLRPSSTLNTRASFSTCISAASRSERAKSGRVSVIAYLRLPRPDPFHSCRRIVVLPPATLSSCWRSAPQLLGGQRLRASPDPSPGASCSLQQKFKNNHRSLSRDIFSAIPPPPHGNCARRRALRALCPARSPGDQCGGKLWCTGCLWRKSVGSSSPRLLRSRSEPVRRRTPHACAKTRLCRPRAIALILPTQISPSHNSAHESPTTHPSRRARDSAKQKWGGMSPGSPARLEIIVLQRLAGIAASQAERRSHCEHPTGTPLQTNSR